MRVVLAQHGIGPPPQQRPGPGSSREAAARTGVQLIGLVDVFGRSSYRSATRRDRTAYETASTRSGLEPGFWTNWYICSIVALMPQEDQLAHSRTPWHGSQGTIHLPDGSKPRRNSDMIRSPTS